MSLSDSIRHGQTKGCTLGAHCADGSASGLSARIRQTRRDCLGHLDRRPSPGHFRSKELLEPMLQGSYIDELLFLVGHSFAVSLSKQSTKSQWQFPVSLAQGFFVIMTETMLDSKWRALDVRIALG